MDLQYVPADVTKSGVHFLSTCCNFDTATLANYGAVLTI